MLYFCTLFDSNYLSRGLALYRSLKRWVPEFHLYVIAFDDLSLAILKDLSLENMTLISLDEFEDDELLRVKPDRSPSEYCWTCTPSSILYVMEKYNLSLCTYLDADLYFYSSPDVLINEMKQHSLLITPHRYTKEFDNTSTSGKYNVQFIPCRNNANGIEAMYWWRQACLDQCELNPEKGLCGDQMYLDDWPSQFKGVWELKHLGGGVAPWNVQQYKFYKNDSKIIGHELAGGEKFDLVFFHFHAVRFWKLFRLFSLKLACLRDSCYSMYPLPISARELIFMPYIFELISQEEMLKQRFPEWRVKPAGWQFVEIDQVLLSKFKGLFASTIRMGNK